MDEDDMEIADFSLEPVVKYGLDPMMAKAYKTMILWTIYSRKIFPDYRWSHGKMPTGDPRKSYLFKVCYKMVRFLEGKLKDDDIGLYVKSQLMIMKAITDGEIHPLLDARMLCSKNSWSRWCIWKKRYDAAIMARSVKIETPDEKKVLFLLEKDKTFLQSIFRHQPTFQDVKDAYESRSFPRWVKLKKLSPYYCLLSPWFKKLLGEAGLQKYLQVDLIPYQIGPSLVNLFQKVFPDES